VKFCLEIMKIDIDVFITTLKLLFGFINVNNTEELLSNYNINDQIDEELLVSFLEQRKTINKTYTYNEYKKNIAVFMENNDYLFNSIDLK